MKVSPRQRADQHEPDCHEQIDPPSAARAHPSARGDPRPAKATVGTRSISFLAAGHHTPSLIRSNHPSRDDIFAPARPSPPIAPSPAEDRSPSPASTGNG